MSRLKIPFFGLNRQFNSIREEILEASANVYSSGQVLDGQYTLEFETQIAARCNRKFAITVNSCSTALLFSMLSVLNHGNGLQRELNKKPRALIPTQSFIATLNSVVMAGFEPVFCDVDHNALLDLSDINYSFKEGGIDVLMYVNLFGNVLDYDKMKLMTDFFDEGTVTIIEDAAQSFGASYKGRPSGSLGDISCLSFDPTKNLPNYGSGGMILTDDAGLRDYILNLKDNGKHNHHRLSGINSKMSEAECAQMIVKLGHFDKWQKRRKDIADYYTQELNDYVYVPRVATDVIHAWHKYVISCPRRGRTMQMMDNLGVETKVHYATPLNFHDIAYDYSVDAGRIFEGSEVHSKNCLSLPIYPELTDAEVEHIVISLKSCVSG